MEDSLKKRYGIKLASSILSGLINAGVLLLVPKSLGPTAFGNYTYLVQFFTQTMALLDAGTSTAFFTKLSSQDNKNELIKFYGLFVSTLFFLIVIFIIALVTFDFGDYFGEGISSKEVSLAILFCFCTWLSQVLFKVSDSFALTVKVELLKIVNKSIFLISIISIVFVSSLSSYTYYWVNIAFCILLMLSILVEFIRIGIISKNTYQVKINIIKNIVDFFKYSSPIFQFSVIGIFVGLLDIWMLKQFSGSDEVGFYGFSYSIAALSIVFTAALTPIITREFSVAYGKKDLVMISNIFKGYVPNLYLMATIIGVFISINSQDVILIFSDERFLSAQVTLSVIALYPLHQTYGQMTSSVLFSLEETRIYRTVGLVYSLIGLIVSFILIYYLDFGALGLVIKMVLIQFFIVNTQLVYICRMLDMKFYYFFVKQISSFVFCLIIAYVISCFDFGINSELYRMIISGFIYSLTVLLAVFLFPKWFFSSGVNLSDFLLRQRK